VDGQVLKCSNAVDGDDSTRWCSNANPAGSPWIEVNLGAVFQIHSLEIKFFPNEHAYSKRYQVCSGTSPGTSSPPSGKCTEVTNGQYTSDVAYISNAQYVRITHLEGGWQGAFSINELRVLGTHPFHCADRVACVDNLDLSVEQFVTFQCECIDQHYEQYRKDGDWPSETPQMCKDFIVCLQTQHTMSSRVVVSLARALGQQQASGSVLVEEKSIRATGKVMPVIAAANKDPDFLLASECFEPTDSSYDALVECDCLKDLVHVCGESLVEDTVGCLFHHACDHSRVCQDWKDSHCHDSSLQMSSSIQESTLLRQLFPADDQEKRHFQGKGMTFVQFQRTASSWGLTAEAQKGMWDSLEKESNRSLSSEQQHRLRDPLIDRSAVLTRSDFQSQDDAESVDAALLGKCVSD
jgi:hypothetical protein